MDLFPILIGLGITALVAVGGLLFRAWSTPSICPDCGDRTAPVARHRFAPEWLERRWCGHCGWTGSGRSGPKFDPRGGPVDHGSGFRWSRRPGPVDPFVWRGTQPSEPQGFAWGESSGNEAEEGESPPSGFQWGRGEGAEAEPGFRWGGAEDGSSSEGEGSQPFVWAPPRPGFQFRSAESDEE